MSVGDQWVHIVREHKFAAVPIEGPVWFWRLREGVVSMDYARCLGALGFALVVALVVLTPNHAQAEGVAAEDLISGGTHQHLLISQEPLDGDSEIARAIPIPLPSTVAMGLLGLTVCTAGICNRRRNVRNRRP